MNITKEETEQAVEKKADMPLRVSITAELRKKIFSGEYPTGHTLSLTKVAAEMKVSRTPVREAFQALEQEGLLELRLNRSAIIVGINSQYIRDHYELRILLEGEAAALATRNHMNATPFLEYAASLPSVTEPLLKEYRDFNQRLHLAIWETAGNTKMTNILLNLWNGPSFGRSISELEHTFLSHQEHLELLQAISEDRPEKARFIMQGHIRRSMNNILASFHGREAD